MFARYLARQEANDRVKTEECGSPDPGNIAAWIEAKISALAADPEIDIATLVFAKLKPKDLLPLAEALSKQPGWTMSETTLTGTPAGDVRAFRITRNLGATPSEVLFFGPFMTYPPTRKAPVAAMELFVGTPRSPERANLADARLSLPGKAFENMWARSKQMRTASLGQPDDRAKAKVSFVLAIAAPKTPKATKEKRTSKKPRGHK